MTTHKNVLTMLLLLFIAYAGLLGYFIITSDVEIDFRINWNMFNSALLWPLAIVGFIVGLGIKFPQYVPFLKITHSDGKVEYKRDYDIVENMFASIVMPLLQVFVIAPLMIAAIIYYPLMILIYFFGKIFPFLILIFFLLTIIMFYKRVSLQLTKSKKAVSITLITILMIGILWLLAILWVSWGTSTSSVKVINIATIVFVGMTIITFIAVEIWLHKKQKPSFTHTASASQISRSFIITYVISLLIIFVAFGFRESSSYSNTATPESFALQPNYVCTATSLNVRTEADLNAKIVGKLPQGENVYVYSINYGFAKIKYKENIAYVRADYLKPKDMSVEAINNNTQTTDDVNTKINKLIGTKLAGYDETAALQNKLGFFCGNQHHYGEGKFVIERWENEKAQKLWLVLIEKISDKESVIRDILPFERQSVGDIGAFEVYNNETKEWSDYMMVQISKNNKLVKIYDVDLHNAKITSKDPEVYWGEVRTEWDSY